MSTTKHEMFMHGWGEVAWSKVREVIGDNTCAWADYDGFHIGECPNTIPPYSHLWAWNDDRSRLFRARIDGNQAILGALTTDSSVSWSGATAMDKPVSILKYQGFTWDDDKRVRQPNSLTKEILAKETVYLFETIQLTPVTFVGISSSA